MISNRMKRSVCIALMMMLCMTTLPALAESGLQPPVVSDPTVEVIPPVEETDDPFLPPDESPAPTDDPTQQPTIEPTAVPTAVPMPTEIPMETESPYELSVTMPLNLTHDAQAIITLQLLDPSSMGVLQLEYRLDGLWEDITASYQMAVDGQIDLTVYDNGTLTTRITDPHGHQFEQETELLVFDRSAPTVTAGIEGRELRVQAQDALSGVAGIQVNGLLFTTMTNGTLTVRIEDVLSKYERLAVRAFDYAGNFSEPITLDNPYYVAEPDPTTAPTATPKPTQTPGTTGPAIATEAPQPIVTATQEPVLVQQPTAEPVVQTEYITIGPGMPYLADGNSHTLDVLYSAATNKQFITMQTKSGNTFFLVIDYDKPIDEDAEMYETYFLNLVDERDLLALMDESELPTATPQIVYVTPEPTAVPVATPVPTQEEPPAKDNKQGTAILALVAMLALGGAGAFFYFKNKKGKTTRRTPSDYGFDDDDDEEDESNDTDA